MCGIVGYTGERNAAEVIVGGLDKLEYRGYDSSGCAVIKNGKIVSRKYLGRLSVLRDDLKANPLFANTGIGHTRWATHGAPSNENAHPHTSNDDLISVVHNGIIENYAQLKTMLIEKGYTFTSETDTETVVHLIRDLYKGDILDAVMNATSQLKGAYSLVVICASEPGRIIATRKDSPLIVGCGKGEQFVASDIPAVLEYTKDVYLLDDNTFADVTPGGIVICDKDKNIIKKDVFHVTWNAEDARKGDYAHFMIKEIYEQPAAITNTLRSRIDEKTRRVTLDDFNLTEEEFGKISKICIVACGTAYYAGCVGKKLFEKYGNKYVECEIASEFRYNHVTIDENTLFIAVSQSGETADTLASLRLAKSRGAKVLAISNVVGSSVAREADSVLYTWAGPEIAVASTKAYSTQVVCMYLLALKMAEYSRSVTQEEYDELFDMCLSLSDSAKKALENDAEIKETAALFKGAQDAFYIGRGIDGCVAMEGSLKMKEISYIHAESYPAGELKHGPIALIEPGTIVVALCTQKGELFEKTRSNIKEVTARGARVIAVTQTRGSGLEKEVEKVLYIDDCANEGAVIPSVIYLQLLSYYAAVSNGCDVDKPRNLAKSVTVE